jgi:hypothetical protein
MTQARRRPSLVAIASGIQALNGIKPSGIQALWHLSQTASKPWGIQALLAMSIVGIQALIRNLIKQLIHDQKKALNLIVKFVNPGEELI